MKMKKMTAAQIAAALPKLDGWKVKAGKLHREYKFPDFKRAMKFMHSAVAGINKMDHHPEWFNVYNKLEVTLSTHDAGCVTDNDIKMAKAMEEFV
jgi:4a-hydroxytetrahydrobiopterin dehydratase